jgi:hypothetical protein
VVKRDTIQRVATPTAILVGVVEPLATVCSDTLAAGGLRVLRVGHVAAACERIPVVMPQLVVVSTTLRPEDIDMLTDRCVAVGAEIVKVAPDTAADGTVRAALEDAANMALIRSLRRGS